MRKNSIIRLQLIMVDQMKQGNCRYQTLPAAYNPLPPSRPIIDSSNACNQASALNVCTPLHGPVQFAIHRVVRLVGHVFHKNCPFPFRYSHPHITHCSSGQAHLSTQTAYRSVQPLLYGSQMLCCTMHVQWGRKPTKTAPSLWDFVNLPEKNRATTIGNMRKKWQRSRV